MSNHLENETSLYLLQHANNPVDWYPWGKEAMDKARAEDRPVLISIGYSACHWCHVMAHESFENPEIAKLMNDNFVNIKIDREERPDLDEVYMQSVVAQTGRGGWPLTVFATPEGKPFYGGTYFPPTQQHGLPGFPSVLHTISDVYRNRRNEVDKSVEQISAALAIENKAFKSQDELGPEMLDEAFQAIKAAFDAVNGGFGSAPKFPQPGVLEFLMRYHYRTKDEDALSMVTLTLDKMAAGGIYDQLGGGFHRYSTDAHWLVPHFEKMLYDNALLSRSYLHAFQITGKPEYRAMVEDIFNFVLRQMTDPSTGAFFSSQDADSEGQEGKFYVWTSSEIDDVLGDSAGETFRQRFGAAESGNFENSNILHLTGDFSVAAFEHDRAARLALRRHREQRVHPGKDTKALASWNGMMLISLAEASCALQRPDYLVSAVKNADFLLGSLLSDNLLRHTASVSEGFLEDYAQIIDAMLWLHQATLSPRWRRLAIKLADILIALFWDDTENVFYDVAISSSDLFTRPRSVQDGAVPSGSAAAVLALLKLAKITDNQGYYQIGGLALRGIGENMARYPLGFSYWLSALDFYFGPSQEVAIIGEPGDAATLALMQAVCRRFRPNTVMAGTAPSNDTAISELPLFKGRTQQDGLSTAYVCSNFVCFPPVTKPEALVILLEG